MFVTKAKLEKARSALVAWQMALNQLQSKYDALIREHNDVVRKINSKGGQIFLDHGIVLSQDDIRSMLSLCHPDKHDGKESATRITQMLLTLKR